MNKTILKQYDSRWSKKPYPSGCTVGGCGCGLLACTHIAIEQESKKNWTPENLRPWMLSKGFAIRNQGTRWEGITETLKHIGHKDVVRIYADPMSEAFKELNKGDRIGILLFNNHTAPNGIRWTSSGHYVAFTAYKVKDGKHYFFCKDSGGRNHSGWYTYENSMRGCISKVWIVQRVKAAKPKKTASPKIDKMIAWAEAQIKRGFKYVNWDGSAAARECPLCHDHKKGGKYWGWNCIGFVSACLKHGMGLSGIKCACNGLLGGNDNYSYLLKTDYKTAQKFVDEKLGKGRFKLIRKKGNEITTKTLKPGDIVIYYIGKEFWHIALYVGNGKIIDSSSGPNGVTKRSWKLAYPVKAGLRYIGK